MHRGICITASLCSRARSTRRGGRATPHIRAQGRRRNLAFGEISRTRENGNEWSNRCGPLSKGNRCPSERMYGACWPERGGAPAVNAQRYCAHHNGREVDRVKTVRCTSFGQLRNWHQMVRMIPVNPVSPPNSPLRNPMPPSAGTLNCIGLSAGRAKPYMLKMRIHGIPLTSRGQCQAKKRCASSGPLHTNRGLGPSDRQSKLRSARLHALRSDHSRRLRRAQKLDQLP